MNDISQKDIASILGYEVDEIELKNKVTQNPNLKKQIESWLEKHLGKGQISAVKICKVEYIDYDNLDYEDLDEFEIKELNKTIKNNVLHCPNHRSCPLYNSNNICLNEKCVLELLDTQHLTKGLFEELEIENTDFNDQILIGQLVGLNIVYNRAMRGLSSAPLIEEVRTFTKGGVNIDTKVNTNFEIIDRTLVLIEKLRKSLILNRDDKVKVKKIKKANDEASAKKRVAQKIRDIEEAQVINPDIASEIIKEKISSDINFEDIEV
ncbi:hypothetical protein [Cetobacterium sp.]|uniref:hypothetical protein n=1 Tax=Cetobacterium sp. TaxID=2071632 RepID=UPI003F2FC08C